MAGPPLDIWLEDELVAQVTERRTGRFQLRYTDAALARWPLGRPLLSVSMPLVPSPHPPGVVGPFLEGLLPEGEALRGCPGGGSRRCRTTAATPGGCDGEQTGR